MNAASIAFCSCSLKVSGKLAINLEPLSLPSFVIQPDASQAAESGRPFGTLDEEPANTVALTAGLNTEANQFGTNDR